MIESFLGFDTWQQIVIGVLVVGGMASWVWGVTVSSIAYRKNKLLKDCPYCEGAGKVIKDRGTGK